VRIFKVSSVQLPCYNFVAEGDQLMRSLKEVRKIAGWTQNRLSRASGINRAKLSQAECGEVELTAAEESVLRRVLLQAIRDRADRIEGVLADASAQPSAATP
jgi:transcriptional regulator with XRE-family HTH domain